MPRFLKSHKSVEALPSRPLTIDATKVAKRTSSVRGRRHAPLSTIHSDQIRLDTTPEKLPEKVPHRSSTGSEANGIVPPSRRGSLNKTRYKHFARGLVPRKSIRELFQRKPATDQDDSLGLLRHRVGSTRQEGTSGSESFITATEELDETEKDPSMGTGMILEKHKNKDRKQAPSLSPMLPQPPSPTLSIDLDNISLGSFNLQTPIQEIRVVKKRGSTVREFIDSSATLMTSTEQKSSFASTAASSDEHQSPRSDGLQSQETVVIRPTTVPKEMGSEISRDTEDKDAHVTSSEEEWEDLELLSEEERAKHQWKVVRKGLRIDSETEEGLNRFYAPRSLILPAEKAWKSAHRNYFPPWAMGLEQSEVVKYMARYQG